MVFEGFSLVTMMLSSSSIVLLSPSMNTVNFLIIPYVIYNELQTCTSKGGN